MTPDNTAVPVTGIHLLRIGDQAIVRAEIDGVWVEVIREHVDGSFSHIVEPAGMRARRHNIRPSTRLERLVEKQNR